MGSSIGGKTDDTIVNVVVDFGVGSILGGGIGCGGESTTGMGGGMTCGGGGATCGGGTITGGGTTTEGG